MHQRLCLKRVPILVFHSVRLRGAPPVAAGADLTLEADVFDAMLASLARGGYRSITCGELHAHLADGAPLPPRPVLLTFDDGYLDNHTVAAPILRRHGFRGTVFVATSFLDPGAEARPTTERSASPPQQGYLRAAELVALEASGTFEVQAHSVEHAILPAGPELAGFHRPLAPCLWLARLRRPERRPFEEEEDWRLWARWGEPVWRARWGGAGPAWRPDPAIAESLAAFVEEEGGEAFFDRPGWSRDLQRRLAELGSRGEPETPAEFRARLLADLAGSRRRLEEILGHPVPFLAWPGGAACAEGVDLALREAGFRATFLTCDPWPGVARDVRAIPRAFFGQEYRGRGDRFLRALRCRGVADFESGRRGGYARIFLANRLMRICGRRPQARPLGTGGA